MFGNIFELQSRILLTLLLSVPALNAAPAEHEHQKTPAEAAKQHWAFVLPKEITAPIPPGLQPRSNPIDAFILAKLRELQIEQAPAASKSELLRRVTYDLTGLPPTVAELKEFLQDRSPDAYEKVVDRLLASQSFGERWTQHWLDLVQYADSDGFELDADRPDAWRYRDWVVKAFNEDMPYDQFIGLQIAGDEVAPENHEALIATGFARSGPREVVGGNIDPEVRRQNELTLATTTVGSVVLGLTVGCARCHDHKFDPIPATDYYALQAYFAGAQLKEIPIHEAARKKEFDQQTKRINDLIKPLAAAKAKLEEPYKDRLSKRKEAGLTPHEREIRAKAKELRTPEEARLFEGISVALKVTWEEIAEAVAENPSDHKAREALKLQIHELQQRLPQPLPHAMAMVEESSKLPDTWVLKRGDVKNKQVVINPRPPGILSAALPGPKNSESLVEAIDAKHSGQRRELTRWLTASSNPLTARVIVNRLWQHHFGQGLVATPSDFGTRGEPPTNQELLDWLSRALIESGWSLKAIHRLIVTSRTYQLSSQPSGASGLIKDPANIYLWRMNRRRMDAEGLRDSTLAVAGVLNRRMGGPGIRTYLEPEVKELIFTEAEVVDLWPVDSNIHEHNRRSIYLHRKRNVHQPMFDAFDAPDAQSSCPERPVSTHAPQALVMMNSRFAQNSAKAFAESLLRSSNVNDARIQEAFLRCYAREPAPDEMQFTREFLAKNAGSEFDRWSDFALALINSNEFIYVP